MLILYKRVKFYLNLLKDIDVCDYSFMQHLATVRVSLSEELF